MKISTLLEMEIVHQLQLRTTILLLNTSLDRPLHWNQLKTIFPCNLLNSHFTKYSMQLICFSPSRVLWMHQAFQVCSMPLFTLPSSQPLFPLKSLSQHLICLCDNNSIFVKSRADLDLLSILLSQSFWHLDLGWFVP